MTAAHDDYFTAPTTPTPGDLSARLPELPEMQSLDAQDSSIVGYTADQMRAYAIAALSALPADGGAPYGNWPEPMIEAAEKYLTGKGVPVYRLGGSFNWHEFFDTIARVGNLTTPQPSAAECPHCVDGIVPMTEGRPCPRCNGVINDAAVGAQGALLSKLRAEMTEMRSTESMNFYIHERWPEIIDRAIAGMTTAPNPPSESALMLTNLAFDGGAGATHEDDDGLLVEGGADDMAEALAGISRTLGCENTLDDILHAIAALAAPAAGKGVDDATLMEGWHGAVNDASEIVGNVTDKRIRKRGTAVLAWLQSHPPALTRQPVAGDGISELRKVAKRNLRSLIVNGSDDKDLMLKCLEELS